MCGIYVSTSNTFSSKKKLEIVDYYLRSRGPDSGKKIVIKDKISFLHRRLAIQDESVDGNQPMCSSEGDFIIVYNGEIYNTKELLHYLKEFHDLELKTNCDTEILIEGFKSEGIKFINKIDGIYAFIIYDKINEEIFAARDPLGIKPLLYSIQDDGILFSSDVKSLFHILEKPLPSNKAIVDLLSLTFVAEPITLFEEIKHLESGIIFHYNLNGEIISSSKINNLKNSIFYSGEDLKKSKTILDKLIKESVKSQTISDTKVGLFLSSGIDSSLILNYLFKIKYKISSAITLVWKPLMNPNDFQEPEKEAKLLASSMGFKSHLDLIAPTNIQGLDKVLSYMAIEGLSDPAALSTYHLSKKARSLGCKVMLCGQGADEIFYGYRRHKAIQLYNFIHRLPRINTNYLNRILSHIKIPYLYRNFKRLFKLISLFGLNKKRFIKKLYYWIDDDLVLKVLKNNHESSLDREINLLNAKSNITHEEIASLDLKFDLKSLNLRYADRMGMFSSIEVRVPFLSNRVLHYANSIPIKYKYSYFKNKRILREISKDHLPKYITNRTKTGFTFPLEEMLQNEQEYIQSLFEIENKFFNNYFNISFIKKYFELFFRGDKNNSQLIFTLIILKICFDDLYL
tara:strand:- start:13594 stop:15474 length:1881 start_codon:yes stop_codon:yes gene_type:complete